MKPGDIFFFDVVPSQIWPLVTFTAIFIFPWGSILNMPKYGVRTNEQEHATWSSFEVYI